MVAWNANESISKEKAELRSPFVAQRLESESRSAPPSYNESQQPRPHTTSWRAPNVEYLRTPLRQESFDDALQTLVQYDTVIIVDDSGSMRGHLWKEASDALQELATIATKYDVDGINVHFINDMDSGIGLTSSAQVAQLFSRVQPRGGTNLGRKLELLTSVYMEKIEQAKKEGGMMQVMKTCKPVNYVIITDGRPTDDVEGPITALAKRLDEGRFSLTQIGLQFLQIGSERSATTFLQTLDDNLHRIHQVRDIVDCTPYIGGPITADMITKILLGGINRRVDVQGSHGLV